MRVFEENQTDGGDGGGGAPNQETIRKAREMGWSPREAWRGNPDAWVDADEFVKRGETFIPFLTQDRKRLRAELAARDSQITSIQEELRATRATLDELVNYNSELARERAETRKQELGVAIRAAREAGDDVRVAELQNQLADVTKAAKQAKKEPDSTETPPDGNANKAPRIEPWLKDWIDDNQEFLKVPRKTALLNALVVEKRQAGDDRKDASFMDDVRDEVEQILEGRQQRQESRTEETRPSGEGRRPKGGGQSYADLPADARAKCDKDEKRFVGPKGSGKAFEKQADWRAFFAKEYFSQ